MVERAWARVVQQAAQDGMAALHLQAVKCLALQQQPQTICWTWFPCCKGVGIVIVKRCYVGFPHTHTHTHTCLFLFYTHTFIFILYTHIFIFIILFFRTHMHARLKQI